jgi:hypothetical protein
MLNRTSFLALAAITSLGVAALMPTSASALGGHQIGKIGPAHNGGGIKIGKPIIGIPKPHLPPVIGLPKPHLPPVIGFPHPHPHWQWQWNWRNRYVSIPAAVGVAAVGGAVYAATPSRPAAPAPTCTCLTKEYLPDGSTLFKDVCTNEAAMAAPAAQQAQGPAQGMAPQAQ